MSTGKDLRLSASMADTIGQLKKQLHAQEDIDATHQRWFFSGKLLTDKTRLQDTKIQKDFVIQVIVNPLASLAHPPSPASAPAPIQAPTPSVTTTTAITSTISITSSALANTTPATDSN